MQTEIPIESCNNRQTKNKLFDNVQIKLFERNYGPTRTSQRTELKIYPLLGFKRNEKNKNRLPLHGGGVESNPKPLSTPRNLKRWNPSVFHVGTKDLLFVKRNTNNRQKRMKTLKAKERKSLLDFRKKKNQGKSKTHSI